MYNYLQPLKLIPFVKENIDKINREYLCINVNAIHILEKNMTEIHWNVLSGNSNAIHILEKNMDKVDWSMLSHNPAAIHILEKNQSKIDWNSFSYNSEIFDYSYEYLEERCNIYKEELIQKSMTPKKFQRYIDEGYDVEEILEFI